MRPDGSLKYRTSAAVPPGGQRNPSTRATGASSSTSRLARRHHRTTWVSGLEPRTQRLRPAALCQLAAHRKLAGRARGRAIENVCYVIGVASARWQRRGCGGGVAIDGQPLSDEHDGDDVETVVLDRRRSSLRTSFRPPRRRRLRAAVERRANCQYMKKRTRIVTRPTWACRRKPRAVAPI